MKKDPNQVFVINAVTRRDIVGDLQSIIEYTCFKHPTGPQDISEDDDRLTDAICQDYANALSDIDESYDEETAEEIRNKAIVTALEAMGFVQEEFDDEREQLLAEIRATEHSLVLKRARLMQLEEDRLNR